MTTATITRHTALAKDDFLKIDVPTPTPVAPGAFLRIEVSYMKGGPSYMSGGTNPRGYTVSLTRWTKSDAGFDSTILCDRASFGFHVARAERLSSKVGAALAAKVEPLIDRIAALWLDGRALDDWSAAKPAIAQELRALNLDGQQGASLIVGR